MSRNGRGADLRLTRGGAASPEEAAAIAAAIERFLAETAVRPAAPAGVGSRWARAALLEGVERDARLMLPAWGDREAWGRSLSRPR